MLVTEEKAVTDAKKVATNINRECDKIASMVKVTDKLEKAYKNLSSKKTTKSS